MVNIILASHGDLATGILMSSQMIVGQNDKIKAVTLRPSQGPDDFKQNVIDTINSFENQDRILFLVDLWGGTPFNVISSIITDHPNWCLITGMNLGMVIEAALTADIHETNEDLLKALKTSSRESINTVPEIVEAKLEKQETKQSFKEGNIDYCLARVDSRLLHGQIATGWCKVLKPNRIIVVSDKIAHDDLRKNLIKRASPADIKAHIIPISKLKEIDNDSRFGDTRALLLFETVQDALTTIEAGVKIKELNLGSIAHKDGKVVVSDALSMDMNDVNDIEKIQSMNVKIDVRKVPSDTAENIDKILEKARTTLKGAN